MTKPAKSSNRFLRMSRFRKAALLLGFLGLLLVTMELGAFGAAFVFKALGLGDSTFTQYKKSFHPLLKGAPLPRRTSVGGKLNWRDWNEYDPWYGYRNSFDLKTGVYATDRMGFITNGDTSRDLSEKAEGLYRIFILGGSTVAGHGIPSPEKTITGRLEAHLNEHRPPDSDLTFQVINAGAAGYYSAVELAYLEFESLYYQPDMIIAFNGYNDLMEIIRRVGKSGGAAPVERYHWNTYHGYLKRFIENPDVGFRLPEKLQLDRYFLSIDILRRLKEQMGARSSKVEIPPLIKEKYPFVGIPEYRPVAASLASLDIGNWLVAAEMDSLEGSVSQEMLRHYTNNVAFMKAVCDQRGVPFLGVLQPVLLPEYRELMTERERFFYEVILQNFAQVKQVNYGKLLAGFTREAALELRERLGDSFVDATGLFRVEGRQIYLDWAHYNPKGTTVISRELARQIFARIYPGEE